MSMDQHGIAERFEAERGQLRAVAYRMLGSTSDAEDAVQEAWFRLGRVDVDQVENLSAWLRTAVTRICLDMLRTRRSRREDLTEQQVFDQARARGSGPEQDALLADSVSRALLIVLDTLEPHERIAFVLHDMFAVPFDQIAPIVDRTQVATKKLASRARQKVRGTPVVPPAELARQRKTVAAFLHAARAGDLAAITAVLAPDVVRRVDPVLLPAGQPLERRGAKSVAEGTLLFAEQAATAELALVDGRIGLVLAPAGRLQYALTFVVADEEIVGYEVIADPERLRRLEIGVLD